MKVTQSKFGDKGIKNIGFSSYSVLKHFLVNNVLIFLIKKEFMRIFKNL